MSCDPCASPVVVNIPGPQGNAGLDGLDGVDGANAFTFSTAPGVVPAELASVTLTVMDSTWASVGQNVSVQFAGEYEVLSKPSAILLTLKNLKDSINSAYLSNMAPGLPIPNGAQISPSGKQGIPGVVAAASAPANATYITQVPHGDLTNEQALSGLPTGLLKSTTGTGLVAHAVPGTDFLDPATGVEVADIGVTVQALNANLTALSIQAGAADRLAYFTNPGVMALTAFTAFMRTLLDDANAAAARLTLGVRYGLLGVGTGLQLNAAPGDLSAIAIGSTKYIVDRVLVTDATISLTTATLGLFGSAGGGAPTICAIQSLAPLTSSVKQHALTISGEGSTDVIIPVFPFTLIPRLGVAQGAAATVSLWVFGYDLS